MTTVSVTTCDRCGKEITEGGSPNTQIKVPDVGMVAYDLHIDLCPECKIAFFAFLTSKEPIEPELGTFAWVLKNAPDTASKFYARTSWTHRSIYKCGDLFRSDSPCHYYSDHLSAKDIMAGDWYVYKDLSEIQEHLEEVSEKKPWFCKRREGA